MKTVTTLFFLFVCAFAAQAKTNEPAKPIAPAGKLSPSLPRLRQMQEGSQMYFVENKGQITDQYYQRRSDIDFKLNGDGLDMFIGSGALHYQFTKVEGISDLKRLHPANGSTHLKTTSYRVDVELVGANKHALPVKEAPADFYENYYLPQCPDGLQAQAWGRLRYVDIYPHIDWLLYIKDNKVEYEFIVKEGGNVNDIRLRYKGAQRLYINDDGSIVAECPPGSISEPAPYCYQADGKAVKAGYRLKGNELMFSVATYKGQLVIDPVLKWATYYGGGQNDAALAVACDSETNIYIVGMTASQNNIATVGAHQTTVVGFDGFIVKFDTSGNRLWGTYYGGDDVDYCTDICTDLFGHLYIAGTTESANGTSIATPNSFQPLYGGSVDDAFLVKFNKDGVRIWGTYYGGENGDYGFSVAADKEGNVYLGGETASDTNIASPGAYKTYHMPGQEDAFLAKFDSSGARKWGTYFGGSQEEGFMDIVYDRNIGGMYVCGDTWSADSIATPGAYQTVYGGGGDAVVAKFDSAGQLLWSTYFGGSGFDSASSITGNEGLIYVCGSTTSTSGIATPGSYQTTYGGGPADAFVARFNITGALMWCTYYGGSNLDIPSDLDAAIGNNTIFIAGRTKSQNGIATPGSFHDAYIGGITDAFLAKIDDLGTAAALVWGTYFGGTNQETEANVAIDKLDNVYLCGGTMSNDYIATPGAFKTVLTDVMDAFLARFRDCEPPTQPDTIYGPVSVCAGTTHTYYIQPVANASSYTWILPPGWTGSSTGDSITVVAGTASGIITVIALNGCDGSQATELSVNVWPPLHPTITNNNGLLSTGSYSTYQWYLNGQPITGATNQNYTVTQGGPYYVHVTNANGCGGNSDTIWAWPLSVQQLTANNEQIDVYPNPVKDVLSIDYDKSMSGEMVLYDMAGRVLVRQVLGHSMDMKGLASGVYMLRIKADAAVLTKMVSKE